MKRNATCRVSPLGHVLTCQELSHLLVMASTGSLDLQRPRVSLSPVVRTEITLATGLLSVTAVRCGSRKTSAFPLRSPLHCTISAGESAGRVLPLFPPRLSLLLSLGASRARLPSRRSSGRGRLWKRDDNDKKKSCSTKTAPTVVLEGRTATAALLDARRLSEGLGRYVEEFVGTIK